MINFEKDSIKKIAFIVAMAFEFNSSIAVYNSIQYMVLLVLLVSLIIDRKLKVNSVLISLLFFVSWNLLSVLWSVDSITSLYTVFMMVKWLFLLFFLSSQKWDLLFVLKSFSIINTVNALLLLPCIDYAASFSGKRGHHILWGVEWAANVAAGLFSISVVLWYYILINEKHNMRRGAILLAQIVLELDILLLGSRQGVLFSVVGCVLLYLVKEWGKSRPKNIVLPGLFFLMGIVGIGCVLSNPVLYNTFGQRLLGFAGTQESDLGRLNLIKVGLLQFLNRPFFGHGTNTYYFVSGKLSAYAHNNFVEILVDTGVVGFVLYHFQHFWIIVHLSQVSDRNQKSLAMVCVCLSLLFEMVIVTDDLFVYNFLLWVGYSVIQKGLESNNTCNDLTEGVMAKL